MTARILAKLAYGIGWGISLEPIPTLKSISEETAAREGFVAITRRIHPKRDPELFESVQQGLAGVNARWIEQKGGSYVAARHKRDLIELERRES